MADSWLQTLVVRGPRPEVSAFRKAAASRQEAVSWTVDGVRRQVLSFEKLYAALPTRPLRRVLPAPVEEPWDLVVDRARRMADGTVEITYRFQLKRYDPDDLIVAVSRQYPRLCFVLAAVGPSFDEQSSRFIHSGRSSLWRLPAARKAVIFDAVPEETDDNADEQYWALVEADWAMMEEVVVHWRGRADMLMANLVGGSAPPTGRKRPARS